MNRNTVIALTAIVLIAVIGYLVFGPGKPDGSTGIGVPSGSTSGLNSGAGVGPNSGAGIKTAPGGGNVGIQTAPGGGNVGTK